MFVVINISDSDKHFDTAQQEYLKRLNKSIRVENIKPVKSGTQDQIIQKETNLLSQKIGKKYKNRTKILLSINGVCIDTIQLSKTYNNKDVLFIIGGPYGLDEKLLYTNFKDIIKISFGKITLPHGLAKLVLLEQIYRISCIKNGKKYHY